MALARPFLSTDRLTTVTSTTSASWAKVMPLASSRSSRCTATPCSDGETTSDGPVQVVAHADAGGEHLGQDEHPQSQDDARARRDGDSPPVEARLPGHLAVEQ